MSTIDEPFYRQEQFVSPAQISPEEEALFNNLACAGSVKDLEGLGDLLMLGKSTIVPMSLREGFDPYKYTFAHTYDFSPSYRQYRLDLHYRSSKRTVKRLVVGQQASNPFGYGTALYLYGANRVQVPPEDPLKGKFVQMMMLLNYDKGKIQCMGGNIKVPVTEFSDVNFGFYQDSVVDDITVGEHTFFKGAQGILLGNSAKSSNTDVGIHVLDQYLSTISGIQGKTINPYLSFKHTIEGTPLSFDVSGKAMIAPPILSHD